MTSAVNSIPLHKRSTRRVTITIPFHVFQFLNQHSMEQGRSVSNLMAFALETWANQQMGKQ